MIVGDKFRIFGHDMEIQEKKTGIDNSEGKMEDMIRYNIVCTCCTYPRNLVIEIADKDLDKIGIQV